MQLHLYLSRSAFIRMIKIRLLGEFRPIDEPSTYRGVPCYMDGLDISSVDLSASTRVQQFALNNLAPAGGLVGAVTVDNPFSPLMVSLNGALLLTPVSSVLAASAPAADGRYGLPDRPENLRIPLFNVHFDVFFSVSPLGVPTLNLAMGKGPDGIGSFPDAQSFLSKFQALALPFPVADAFGDVLPPGRNKVLNAGIALTGEDVVIRLEFEPEVQSPAANAARLSAWLTFLNGAQPSRLAGRDWAIELPTSEMAARAAKEFDDSFNDKDIKKHFSGTGPAWASFEAGWPGFAFRKEGIAESACAGLDIRTKILADATLSVPAPDTIRMSVDVDIDIDDWDSVKCIALSLVNPFAGAITTFDNDLPWWAVFPVSILLPLAPIAFGLGVDDLLVKEAIKSAQDAAAKKGGPTIVRTSLSSFYVDVPKRIQTSLTRDWTRLEAIAGVGDRLVLSGAFTAPDIRTLPRLRGRLDDGFDFWSKKNRCSSNPQWVTNATLSISLEDEFGATVYVPLVPLRYGIDVQQVGGAMVEVGQVTWRVIADPEHVYDGVATRVHWTGIPGVFEIEVLHPKEPFRSQPYDFRMQLFTSAGVREFRVPAPPPVPLPPEDREARIFEAAERISNCYIFSSLLTMVKALQVAWLPRPAEHLEVGQHWQVIIEGLAPSDRIRAWNARSGELLADVRAFDGGMAEVTLALPAGQTMHMLQLTLNDAPLLEADAYSRRAGEIGSAEGLGQNPVRIRQTPLYQVARIALDRPVEVVVPQLMKDRLRILVQERGGMVKQIDVDLEQPALVLRRSAAIRGEFLRAQLPASFLALARAEHEGQEVIELARRDHGTESTMARYFARPWYDRGGVAGGFFTQLDDTGTHLVVYRRGITREASPEVGAARPRELAAL